MKKLTEKEHNQGFNTCDKCKNVADSMDLIWITSEDFEAKKGEVVPKWAFKKYDALCENCYFEVIS